jgi:hypothetical protein
MCLGLSLRLEETKLPPICFMGTVLQELSFLPAESLSSQCQFRCDWIDRMVLLRRSRSVRQLSRASLSVAWGRRRLTRIRVTLGKSFFERSVVSVDVVVKMNDSILSYDNGAIQN